MLLQPALYSRAGGFELGPVFGIAATAECGYPVEALPHPRTGFASIRRLRSWHTVLQDFETTADTTHGRPP
jgi:hypothetical protein